MSIFVSLGKEVVVAAMLANAMGRNEMEIGLVGKLLQRFLQTFVVVTFHKGIFPGHGK